MKVHVGLPYISDLETLDIDSLGGETLADKKKNITQITAAVEESRGMWFGPKAPTGADATEGLQEYKPRGSEPMGEVPTLITDNIEITIRGDYNNNGRVLVRQIDPLPVSISAIHPAGELPFRGRR